MKRIGTIVAVAGLVMVVAGCSLFGIGKGLVTFYGNPSYNTTTELLSFDAAFAPSFGQGSAVAIEYEVREGASVITNGSMQADSYDSAFSHWTTGMESVSLPMSTYSGATITIALDPDSKLQALQWQADGLDSREHEMTLP